MTNQNHLAQITKRLKSSSAVVPALLLTLICTPTGALAARFSPEPINLVFLGMAIIAPLLTAVQIAFFTIWDRDRLQNEDHVERKMIITRTAPELGSASTVIELVDVAELTANPSAEGVADV
jgi:hypothetical protein